MIPIPCFPPISFNSSKIAVNDFALPFNLTGNPFSHSITTCSGSSGAFSGDVDNTNKWS